MNYRTNFGCTVSHWSHFHGDFDTVSSIFFKALYGLGAMWFDGELSHWNPYKSSTWAISQHGNDVSKNVECWYLFLGHGAHSLPSQLKNPPVVAVALCNLFKEQHLSCCRLNSSTDFCFHLIKLQLICLLVGLIYCLNCADDPHKIHLLLHLLSRCRAELGWAVMRELFILN